MSVLSRLLSPSALRRLALPIVATLIALPLVHGLRDYSWPQSWVTALAVGALAYVTRRTFEQIRRPPAPWPDHERDDQQDMYEAAADPADQEKEQP